MFNNNLKALNTINSELANRISAISIEEAKKNIEVFQSPSSHLVIAYKNIPLDNPDNPIQDSLTNWQNNIKDSLSKNDIVICFGLGLGYLFKRAYISSPSKIIVYEPNIEILRFVFEYVDFSEQLLDKRVFITDNENEISDYISEKYLINDKIDFIYPPGYLNINPKELLSISEKIIETCKSKSSDINTITRLSKLWIENNLKNLKFLKNSRPVNILKDKFIGKTALILAAGPSLKDDIQIIKQNRNKYVIFAVNKIFDYIVQNDVLPDFLVAADARYVNLTVKELEKVSSRINLITTTKVDNSIFKNKFNTIFNYYLKNDAVNTELNKLFPESIELLDTEGTAVSQCYYSAKLMGFSNIIFSGLDLAIKNMSTAYANGEEINMISPEQILVSAEEKKFVAVKSVTGDLIATRDDYAIFIKQLESAFSKNKTAVIYNTTNFGAYIEGMKYQPLNEIAEKIESTNIDINKTLNIMFTDSETQWEKIFERFENMISEQKFHIEAIAKKIENWLTKYKQKIESKDCSIEKLNEIKKEELSTIKDILDNVILGSYLQSEILEYTELNKAQESSKEESVEKRLYTINLFESALLESKNLLNA